MTALMVAALLAAPPVPRPAESVALHTIDAKGLVALRRNETQRLRLISVWATWCGPCVVELPDVVALHREQGGPRFEVTTLSADAIEQREAVLARLRREQATTDNYIFTGASASLSSTLDPSWNGSLPFALLVAPGGRVLVRSEGVLEVDRIREAIRAWIESATR